MSLDIDNLLAELTLEEKAVLTSGSSFWTTAAVPRLGIPSIMVSDGPHGLRAQPGEVDHLGLGESVPATCFPTASAIASSWDPGLLHEVGQALAVEAKATGVSVILGPGVNMKRSPLCGRNFEYLSEDPHLAGELAVGIVDGIQSGGVGTSVKHYAANNQESDRFRVDARVDERALREIYLPAFERVVTAGAPWTVMCSYNKVNGVSASENAWLLSTVLREEMGFTGVVVSDWGAVYHRVPALLAGTDLEMPPAGSSPDEVAAAVRDGRVSAVILDARVRAVLGLVDKAMPALGSPEGFDADAHHALARRAAGESIVLLENDGLLPLAPGTSVAVIGELASTARFQGAGSSQVNPTRVETVLKELRAAHDGDVSFAPGYAMDGDDEESALVAQAEQAAREADTVVMVIGLPPAAESEGFDRTHMDLPAHQLAVLRAVADVNPDVVVVLVNGSTVVLGEVAPHARAVVEAWLGGQGAGGGIADVLTGALNPAGRLAESIPHRLEDASSYLTFPGEDSVVRYGEGIFIGYRGYDTTDTEVAYPFGHGLSYTTFALSDLRVDARGAVADGTWAATVSVTVTNTGAVAGAHVVQVYVGDVEASVARPPRELKGFTKVTLAPGEAREVSIGLDQRALAFWSIRLGRWAVEAGDFVISAGASSRDLSLTSTLSVEAPSLASPLRRESTLAEWLADPAGRALVEAEVAAGQPSAILDGPEVALLASIPMSTLVTFGNSLDDQALDRVTAAWQDEHR